VTACAGKEKGRNENAGKENAGKEKLKCGPRLFLSPRRWGLSH